METTNHLDLLDPDDRADVNPDWTCLDTHQDPDGTTHVCTRSVDHQADDDGPCSCPCGLDFWTVW